MLRPRGCRDGPGRDVRRHAGNNIVVRDGYNPCQLDAEPYGYVTFHQVPASTPAVTNSGRRRRRRSARAGSETTVNFRFPRILPAPDDRRRPRAAQSSSRALLPAAIRSSFVSLSFPSLREGYAVCHSYGVIYTKHFGYTLNDGGHGRSTGQCFVRSRNGFDDNYLCTLFRPYRRREEKIIINVTKKSLYPMILFFFSFTPFLIPLPRICSFCLF